MITLTKLNGKEIFLNDNLIETIEETPDTVLTLTTGKRYIVKESGKEVVGRIMNFNKKIHSNEYEITEK